MLLQMPVLPAGAATLTTTRDYLTRQKASLTTGEKHQIFFTATTAVSGGSGNNKVFIQFPDADDGLWCRTAGSDLTVVGITDPLGGTESATTLPGSLTAACSQGSGASSFDKITINNVNNLSAATKYGFSVTDGATGKLGSAAAANNIKVIVTTNNGTTDVDNTTIALALVSDDQIAVSATVDPTLSVSLSSNTAALGTLSTSNVNQAGLTSTVSTNAANGYTSVASYNATLTSGVNTIPDTAGGTIVAGESEFGASTSQASNTISQWNPTTCATTASTSTATALSTTPKSYASSATAVSGQVVTLCFLASTTATQAPGSYTSTVTLVTTAKF